MPLTSYPGIDALLDRLRTGLQATLGEKLVGLYLYGSLVSGAFEGQISDIDLLAVTSEDIDDKEFAALHRLHTGIIADHPNWADRLEIAYLSQAALQTFRTRTSRMAVMSPGEPFHFKEAGADWLMNWYLVRTVGRTVFGPPPTALIDPIAREEFLQAVQDHARAWPAWIQDMRAPKEQAYAILTLCRALYVMHHGEQPSKIQAAMWIEQVFPAWAPLIRTALLWRERPHIDPADAAASYPETLRFVEFAVAQVTAGERR